MVFSGSFNSSLNAGDIDLTRSYGVTRDVISWNEDASLYLIS